MISSDELGMLWQGTEKTFDELVRIAVEYFYKKMKFYPKRIMVNSAIQSEKYKDIPLVKDSQMYNVNLICMMYDIKSTKENDND